MRRHPVGTDQLKKDVVKKGKQTMKKQDLIELGIAEDVAEKIIILHGKDIESHKAKITEAKGETETARAEVEALKGQLTEAGATIESFKAMKPEELKTAAADWQAKFEQAQKDHAAALVTMDFYREYDSAVSAAKVKYPNEFKARIKLDELRDRDGKFIAERFAQQVEKIKSEAADLFADDKPQPQIVAGAQNQKTTVPDAITQAVRKAAGLATS